MAKRLRNSPIKGNRTKKLIRKTELIIFHPSSEILITAVKLS